MKHLTVIFLSISGLLLLAIGATILVVPHAFYASDGIVLGSDPSLLSEIRAPGGFLAGSGLCILTGTFRDHLRSLSVLLTVLVYGSFGLSRLLSLVLDGIPSDSLVIATVIEVAVAAIGLIVFYQLSDDSLSAPLHRPTMDSRR